MDAARINVPILDESFDFGPAREVARLSAAVLDRLRDVIAD